MPTRSPCLPDPEGQSRRHRPSWLARWSSGGAGGEFRPKEKDYILPLGQIAPDAKEHPVQLTDKSGKLILDDQGKPILRPAHLDPEFFVRQGLAMGEKLKAEQLLSQNGNYMPLPTLLPDLMRFKQGGDWDAQRVGGKNVIEYQDYATIAIGLYAAAANVPVEDILARQNDYAHLFSRFGPKTPMDSAIRICLSGMSGTPNSVMTYFNPDASPVGIPENASR